MKITNFRDYRRTGGHCLAYRYNAIVDVEVGFLWMRKKYSREISRTYLGKWFFVDDGKFCPEDIVNQLCRVYEATNENYLS